MEGITVALPPNLVDAFPPFFVEARLQALGGGGGRAVPISVVVGGDYPHEPPRLLLHNISGTGEPVGEPEEWVLPCLQQPTAVADVGAGGGANGGGGGGGRGQQAWNSELDELKTVLLAAQAALPARLNWCVGNSP